MTGWAPLRQHYCGLRPWCARLCRLVHVHEGPLTQSGWSGNHTRGNTALFTCSGRPVHPCRHPRGAAQALALACRVLESAASPAPPWGGQACSLLRLYSWVLGKALGPLGPWFPGLRAGSLGQASASLQANLDLYEGSLKEFSLYFYRGIHHRSLQITNDLMA